MNQKIKYGKPSGFLDSFDRRPGPVKKNMHYCPGCGHGILHKLIAEAISDFEMQDNMVILSPVGCSVFAYYYFDACGISVPHGRAPSVGTGILRANPDSYVISYQGDGDLGAIGFNNFIQAANRGENMTVCFVNNAIYGMTGGQMAPTTLPGQVTTTSPYGRSVDNEGYPLKVAEIVATLDSPIYVERVALTSNKNIRVARTALRKGLKYMKERKGFSFIEFLAGCPVGLKKTAIETDEWIEGSMIPYFPLGCKKDIADTRSPIVRPIGIYDTDKVEQILRDHEPGQKITKKTKLRKNLHIKCAGFGGQGILSLGLMLASMGQSRDLEVTWLPSYGPEMRGGTANCSVVLSNKKIGSPIVIKPNILIAMNQPSVDKFLHQLSPNGIFLYDSTYIETPKESIRLCYVPAAKIATSLGNVKFANSVILGAFSSILAGFEQEDFENAFEEAIRRAFSSRKELFDLNILAFKEGKNAVKRSW